MDLYLSRLCGFVMEEVECLWLRCRFLDAFPVTSSGLERYTPKGSREISQAGQGQ